MAFDQATRNRLSKFVADTRKLLSDEFAQQMRVKYGLDPATGIVTDIDKLPTMAEGDRQSAQMLRDTLEHYLASSTKRDKKLIATTIDRIVREQAFTVLNRLCAVRMAEARDLVIESIAQGTKSKGFQLYARLAGSALGETGEAYVCYLFSLFDELSIDLPVLFDRFSPSGRLFPKESVLLEVLEQINHHELQHLWAEDETIGWVYQYFNSQEERRAMRDESSAPRNSRELAVRNQFFTPRYVVEFLTDNTLGRIWYEMTQGQTRLANDCKYLARRPDEVFLSHMTSMDQEHPSDGTIAMAERLHSGTEDTFPEFNAHDQQPMIELAHCVSAYTTMGDRAHEILANRTLAVSERSGHEPREVIDAVDAAPYVFGGQPGMLKTQHILEVLFMTCRSDRHGGDGSVYSEPWFVDACNEVRRRVLNSRRDDFSQEELVRQPVFIPFRPMKDPRDIKMLDPACGSMHFGLYAFDLFLRIYEESWELEERLGDQAFVRGQELKSLRESYGTRESYLLDVPRLIIERNIHGIDIDSRAVQIAGLSLWLRAQKAWHEAGIKQIARPRVTRSNIVCAEPMPGEADLLEQFIIDHLSQTSEQQTIASIVRRVFDAMKLAGEAGSLLRIEAEIAETIAEAKKKWVEGPKPLQLPLFAIDDKQKDSGPRPLLVAGIDDESFWDEIEERIYNALGDYGQRAGGGFKHKLFANDTVQGFAFIDLCRKRYDLALMNPPFGLFTDGGLAYAKKYFPDASNDFYAAFVQRSLQSLCAGGKVGVISSRLGFFLDGLENWREQFFAEKYSLRLLADLGYGVLDAVVETAAYVIDFDVKNDLLMAISALSAKEKEPLIAEATEAVRYGKAFTGVFVSRLSSLSLLPGKVLAYWLSLKFLNGLSRIPPVKARDVSVYSGLQTDDDFRFLRLWWECPNAQIQKTWMPFAKGGEYQPFADDLHLVVNWKDDGLEMKAFVASKYVNWSRHIKNIDRYFIPGLTYSERTTSDISVRAFPQGAIFSVSGPVLQAADEDDLYVMWAHFNCRLGRTLIEMAVGSGDTSRSGTAARHYRTGILSDTPCPVFEKKDVELFKRCVTELYRLNLAMRRSDETHWLYDPTGIGGDRINSIAKSEWISELDAFAFAAKCSHEIDCLINEAFGVTDDEITALAGPHPITQIKNLNERSRDELSELALMDESTLCAYALEHGVHPRTATKKTFFISRELELISAITGYSVDSIVSELSQIPYLWERKQASCVERLVSRLIGCVFGRWDICDAMADDTAVEIPDPFAPLPPCPPGQLRNSEGVPCNPKDLCENYPIDVSWNGILVDDLNHPLDIERRVREAIEAVWREERGGTAPEVLEQEACEILEVRSLRDYLQKPTRFFSDHLKRYSKSRRQAPIYWPLSTDSGSYTVWVYYHRLTDQTLFTVVNDFVEPKQKSVNDDLKALRSRRDRSKAEEEEVERLSALSTELEDFRKELRRIAEFWKPNLNDGVQIISSPLWRFFRLKKWRDILKKTWEEIEGGKYDWAHLSLSLWPERVVRSAHRDRSLAIAHNLVDLLWQEVEVQKPGKAGRLTLRLEWQPRELTEKEIDTIVHQIKSGELRVVIDEKRQS